MTFRASRRQRSNGNSNKVDNIKLKVQNCGGGYENRHIGSEIRQSVAWRTLRAITIVICILAAQTAVFAENAPWLEAIKSDFNEFPDRFIEDSRDTFINENNFMALVMAGAASFVMHNGGIDDNIAEDFARDNRFHGFADESLYIIGTPETHFAATALWYAVEAQNGDELSKERALTMMTALSVNGIVTLGLKVIRHNDTPNGHSLAWPSGHTSSSFTVASVLHEYYGLKVGIPAYILASVIAYRMMDTGDHWASDVVFGGTLGWVVGHTVANKHKKLEVAGFSVIPYWAGEEKAALGVGLVRTF